jgi:hypothetical protein
MYKKIFATSLVAASLLLSGCGEDSTSCRFDVQNDLDTGAFDRAIEALNGECATSFNDSDRYFNLASAYMGKANFGAIDVVNLLLDVDDEADDAFASFTRSVDEYKDDTSLEYLGKAQEYFLRAINPDANVSTLTTSVCDSSSDFNDSRISNACFYIGFNQTIQATTTVTYLTNDVDSFASALESDSEEVPLDMQVSVDALAWATGSTLANGSTVTASDVNISGNVYKHLELVNNGLTFYRLATANAPASDASTLITDGYCDSDGNKTVCEGIEDNATGAITDTTLACYACPVTLGDGSGQNIAELLVDTLNGGTDAIGGVTNDEDIQDGVDDFIRDIKGLDADANVSNVDVTIDDILQYLNNEQ